MLQGTLKKGKKGKGKKGKVVSVKVRTFEFRVNLGTGSSLAFSPRGEPQSLRDCFVRYERLLLLLFPKPFHVQVSLRAPARARDVPQSRRDQHQR